MRGSCAFTPNRGTMRTITIIAIKAVTTTAQIRYARQPQVVAPPYIEPFFTREGLAEVGSLVRATLMEGESSNRAAVAATGVPLRAIKSFKALETVEYWPSVEHLLAIAPIVKKSTGGGFFTGPELLRIATGERFGAIGDLPGFDRGAFERWAEEQVDQVALINARTAIDGVIEERLQVLESKRVSPLAGVVNSVLRDGYTRSQFATACGCTLPELSILLDGEFAKLPPGLWGSIAQGLAALGKGDWTVPQLQLVDRERVFSSAVSSGRLDRN